MFSKKATKNDGEDFINFCGLLRKHGLYQNHDESVPQVCWHYYSVKREGNHSQCEEVNGSICIKMGHLFIVGAELMLGPYSLWQYLFLSFKFGDTKLVSSKETSVYFQVEWCYCFKDWPILTFNICFWNISLENWP